jgi:hypothetical protein
MNQRTLSLAVLTVTVVTCAAVIGRSALAARGSAVVPGLRAHMLAYLVAAIVTGGAMILFYNSLIIVLVVSIGLTALALAWLWCRLVQSVLRIGLHPASGVVPLVGSSVAIAALPYAVFGGGGPQ